MDYNRHRGKTTYFEDNLITQDSELSQLLKLKRELEIRGIDMIDLSMVNPDLPPPREGIDALVDACYKTHLHRYSSSVGIKGLRNAIREKYKHRFGVVLEEENTIISSGTKGALLDLVRVLSTSFRKMCVVSPVYPVYRSVAHYFGINLIELPLLEGEEAFLSALFNELATKGVGVVVVNFPSNPSGYVADKDFLQEIVSICARFDVPLINDFVYGELGYDDNNSPMSVLRLSSKDQKVVEIYSLSKAYSVAGWRIASVCGNSEIIRKVSVVKSKVDYGIFLPLQIAAIQLLRDPNIALFYRAQYRSRAHFVLKSLEEMGICACIPKAGTSIFARIPEYCLSNEQANNGWLFSMDLLTETGVCVLPGSAFGKAYSDFVRISLGVGEDVLARAMNKIRAFLDARRLREAQVI